MGRNLNKHMVVEVSPLIKIAKSVEFSSAVDLNMHTGVRDRIRGRHKHIGALVSVDSSSAADLNTHTGQG